MWTTHDLKTTFKLTKLFKELNAKYFHNRLGVCTFEALPDPATDVPAAACIRPYKRRTCGYTAKIKFNSRIPWTEKTIREVLIHELIHYYNHVKYRRAFFCPHGLRFQLMMWKINLLHKEHIRTYWHYGRLTFSDGRK